MAENAERQYRKMKKSKKVIAALFVMSVVLGGAGFGAISQAKAQQTEAGQETTSETAVFLQEEPETEPEPESETAAQTTEYEEDTEAAGEDMAETEIAEESSEAFQQREEQPEVSDTVQEPETEAESVPLTGVEQYGYQYDTGYIFMGDSRIYLMNEDCSIGAPGNFFAVCCPGIGYDWMMETGLPKIKNIQSVHSEIKNWVVVSALGINDMQNVNKYISAYRKLSKSVDLWLVSINPTVGRTEAQYNNVCIEAFNRRIRKISGITYINSYDYLTQKGYDTKDGLHYTEASNWDIYSYMLNSLLVGRNCAPAADTDAKQLAQSLEKELSRANY